MSRPSIATPCPAPYGQSSLPIPAPNRRLSTTSFGGDDTTEIEYTRAFSVGLQNTKPRRKSTFQKKERSQAPVTIFEDVIEDQELVVEPRRDIGGSVLLGKRAQRIPGHAMRPRPETIAESQPLRQIGQNERRSSIAPAPPAIQEDETLSVDARIPQKRSQGGLTKEPRRRTIFVPTDDTSILTIHPGMHNTSRLDDTFQLPNLPIGAIAPPPAHHNAQTEVAPAPAKKSRMSLAVAPKRLPLQNVPVSDGNASGPDMHGQNGGKENVPPKVTAIVDDKKPASSLHRPARRVSLAQSKLFEPTAASHARQTVFSRNAVPLSAKCGSTPPKAIEHATTQSMRPRVSLRPSPPRVEQTNIRKPGGSPSSTKQTRRISPHLRSGPTERRMEAKTARLQQYPVLSEDLAQPELYEDSWLGHQEVALAELINQIFRDADQNVRSHRPMHGDLRERMVELYHQPFVTNLHKRLQASLLYGALSRPRDMSNLPNPAQDIGLRKRFLSMWLDSYSAEGLRTAAEVVFGRQLPKPSAEAGSGLNEAVLDPHKNRRSLIRFLETFLIEVDDVEAPDEERGDDPNNRWRKMVLRSLMLIWLLDQSKKAEIIQRCLFKPASHRKSSVAMLQSLVCMLIPSIGEITRVLRHLDYEVDHIQDPLDEVRYRIDNIAVDLRDGILLTKLTEILLFSPTRLRAADMTDNATVTIKMPDLTILESALYNAEDTQCPRILSQHLKMPCLGRAQKTFNVDIAVSALRDHGRLADDDSCFTTDDIVDGHRERTLSFLWSLVSNHGLDHLLDFQELRADIKRNGGAAIDRQTMALSEDSQYFSQMQQESLLKKWASVYAARSGLRIGNLTTSFADGKAYAAILDAFADYITIKPGLAATSTTNTRLEAQLQAFGCSNAFIKQLASTSGTIPSRKTTISNLAFLASRLLPLARQHNAAVTIQRKIRQRQARTRASQRIALMRLAHACATVVQTQQKLVFAATTLQRAWRDVLDCRIRRLNGHVEAFQCVAKGWVTRRQCQMEGSGVRSLRVMGGW